MSGMFGLGSWFDCMLMESNFNLDRVLTRAKEYFNTGDYTGKEAFYMAMEDFGLDENDFMKSDLNKLVSLVMQLDEF